MIDLPGSLAIKIIKGRNGPFRIGNLRVDIGSFMVKDKELDQYPEGVYEGKFDISHIGLFNYSTGGRLVVEVRAILDNIALVNADTIQQDQFESLERDPLDEEISVKTDVSESTASETHSNESVDDNKDENPLPEETEVSEVSPDAKLFGLLWPLHASFKLDATVERSIFRQQGKRLLELGYKLEPVSQYWKKT